MNRFFVTIYSGAHSYYKQTAEKIYIHIYSNK